MVIDHGTVVMWVGRADKSGPMSADSASVFVEHSLHFVDSEETQMKTNNESTSKSVTPVDELVRTLERRAAHAREELTKKARYLADDMNRLAARLDAQGADAHVNSLGEVQRQGADIDRLCGEFMGMKRHLEELAAALARNATAKAK
ncbi:MAG TPA: hypothetical protein VJ891_10055 [Casimicrobiaceae bacterium]|nr:hypothetical protein [Casimicrobiaceae bacterium]